MGSFHLTQPMFTWMKKPCWVISLTFVEWTMYLQIWWLQNDVKRLLWDSKHFVKSGALQYAAHTVKYSMVRLRIMSLTNTFTLLSKWGHSIGFFSHVHTIWRRTKVFLLLDENPSAVYCNLQILWSRLTQCYWFTVTINFIIYIYISINKTHFKALFICNKVTSGRMHKTLRQVSYLLLILFVL